MTGNFNSIFTVLRHLSLSSLHRQLTLTASKATYPIIDAPNLPEPPSRIPVHLNGPSLPFFYFRFFDFPRTFQQPGSNGSHSHTPFVLARFKKLQGLLSRIEQCFLYPPAHMGNEEGIEFGTRTKSHLGLHNSHEEPWNKEPVDLIQRLVTVRRVHQTEERMLRSGTVTETSDIKARQI